jgi:phytoene dehydrogenase-like protein
MANKYDAIVIGGGHNGLVAGAYLARAGAKAVVLESLPKCGGAAASENPWPEGPEFKVTKYSYVMSLMPNTILRDLKLKEHGYKVFPMGPYYQAWPDGHSIKLYADDAKLNYESIAKVSKKDAETMPKWDAWLHGIAQVLGPMLMQIPPKLGSKSIGDLLDQAQTGWKFRKLDVRGVADVTRLFTMSITDLLDDWFESVEVKAALAVNGIIGTWAGPDSPGTAYVMVHHSIGDVGDGHLGGWGFAEGGMGGVSAAIERSAKAFGCEIRTSAAVERVIVKSGRAVGVVLKSGEELLAPAVITSVHPKIAFLKHLDKKDLPSDFVTDIERWKTRSGVVKVNLALSELPSFTANPGSQPQEHHSGSVELCLSTKYCEQAFQDAKAGRAAARPFVDGVIPSYWDKTLAPEGKHIFSMFTQWVPCEWDKEPHRDELEAYADRIIDGYNELAPNFKRSILHRQVLGPYDMEQELGMLGGNIFHGELSTEQLFHMRPAAGYADFRTPIAGLYQASSATHGGGGVTGIPAYQAVKQIQKDRALAK